MSKELLKKAIESEGGINSLSDAEKSQLTSFMKTRDERTQRLAKVAVERGMMDADGKPTLSDQDQAALTEGVISANPAATVRKRMTQSNAKDPAALKMYLDSKLRPEYEKETGKKGAEDADIVAWATGQEPRSRAKKLALKVTDNAGMLPAVAAATVGGTIHNAGYALGDYLLSKAVGGERSTRFMSPKEVISIPQELAKQQESRDLQDIALRGTPGAEGPGVIESLKQAALHPINTLQSAGEMMMNPRDAAVNAALIPVSGGAVALARGSRFGKIAKAADYARSANPLVRAGGGLTQAVGEGTASALATEGLSERDLSASNVATGAATAVPMFAALHGGSEILGRSARAKAQAESAGAENAGIDPALLDETGVDPQASEAAYQELIQEQAAAKRGYIKETPTLDRLIKDANSGDPVAADLLSRYTTEAADDVDVAMARQISEETGMPTQRSLEIARKNRIEGERATQMSPAQQDAALKRTQGDALREFTQQQNLLHEGESITTLESKKAQDAALRAVAEIKAKAKANGVEPDLSGIHPDLLGNRHSLAAKVDAAIAEEKFVRSTFDLAEEMRVKRANAADDATQRAIDIEEGQRTEAMKRTRDAEIEQARARNALATFDPMDETIPTPEGVRFIDSKPKDIVAAARTALRDEQLGGDATTSQAFIDAIGDKKVAEKILNALRSTNDDVGMMPTIEAYLQEGRKRMDSAGEVQKTQLKAGMAEPDMIGKAAVEGAVPATDPVTAALSNDVTAITEHVRSKNPKIAKQAISDLADLAVTNPEVGKSLGLSDATVSALANPKSAAGKVAKVAAAERVAEIAKQSGELERRLGKFKLQKP